jgi:antitoxin ParD1/3/4
MNVSLTPELEQLVNNKVKSGMYHSASEVIREGLRLLKEQDDLRQSRINQLRQEVDIGVKQIERGQYTDYDVDNLQPLVDEIQAEGRKRLAKRTGELRK